MHLSICQGREGSGGLEGISGSISGYKPQLLVLPRELCHDQWSLGKYWGGYPYAHLRLPSDLLVQPIGSAGISSWALPASCMPTGTGQGQRFFALSPKSCEWMKVTLQQLRAIIWRRLDLCPPSLYYSHKLHFWHHLEARNVSNPHTSNAIDIKYLSSSPKPLGVFWALHPGKWLVRDDFSKRGSM